MMAYIGRVSLGHARAVAAVLVLAIALVVMVGGTSFTADGDTTLASVDSSENQADNTSEHSSISADGRFVAFESTAKSLVTGDTNGFPGVFVHEVDKTAPTLDTSNSDKVEPDNGALAAPRLTSVWATFSDLDLQDRTQITLPAE